MQESGRALWPEMIEILLEPWRANGYLVMDNVGGIVAEAFYAEAAVMMARDHNTAKKREQAKAALREIEKGLAWMWQEEGDAIDVAHQRAISALRALEEETP